MAAHQRDCPLLHFVLLLFQDSKRLNKTNKGDQIKKKKTHFNAIYWLSTIMQITSRWQFKYGLGAFFLQHSGFSILSVFHWYVVFTVNLKKDNPNQQVSIYTLSTLAVNPTLHF